MKTYSIFLILVLTVGIGRSQHPVIKTLPLWVQIMDHEELNYFDALHDFESYWATHEKPVEEEELFGAAETTESESAHLMKKKQQAPVPLEAEYRRFLYWKQKISPWVLSDGRIMSKPERLQQWKENLESRK